MQVNGVGRSGVGRGLEVEHDACQTIGGGINHRVQEEGDGLQSDAGRNCIGKLDAQGLAGLREEDAIRSGADGGGGAGLKCSWSAAR